MSPRTSRLLRSWAPALALCLGLPVAGCDAPVVAQGPAGPPPVTVAYPLQRDIVDWDDYIGRFEAVRKTDIRPRISGHIVRVNFTDGQMVQQGQVLYEIDSRPLVATLNQARAEVERASTSLDLARRELGRSRALLAAEAVSREEFETRQAAMASAGASLKAAQATAAARQLDVDYTRVRAPISGRVSDTRVDIGNLVQGSSAGEATLLTTVVSVNPIHFTFEGSEAVYLKYQRQNREGSRTSSRQASNPVEIRLQDDPNYSVRGRMDFVDNVIETRSGTIRGRALVPNQDGFLTPGMFGRMRLLGSGAYRALLVPESAIVTDQTRRMVMTVQQNGIVEPREVEVGPVVDGLRTVRKGLGPRDRIIIAGLQRVRPGDTATAQPGRIVARPGGQSPDPVRYSAPPAGSASPAGSAR